MLTIITKALTVDNPHKNYVKQKILDTIETTDWSAAFQGMESGFDSFSLAGTTEPLATNVATTLGPSDSFLEILTFYQRTLNLPGIIKDLQNLIGPRLVITVLSVLLKKTVAVFFQSIINSWGDLEIQNFMQFNLLIQWFQTNAASLVPPNSTPDIDWENITTFSGLFRKILSFLELVKISVLIKVLNTITNILLLAFEANSLVFNAFIDLASLFIGGLMYLLNPLQGIPLSDIIFFLGMSLLSRIFNLTAEWMSTDIDKTLAKLLSVICVQINWSFIGGWPIDTLGIPGGYFLKTYGSLWNYLGSNVVSHLLNQIGSLIDALAPFPEFKAIFLPLIQGKISYNHLIILLSQGAGIFAGTITTLATFIPIFGDETLPNHISDNNIVWLGDVMFIIQAGLFHIFINADKALKEWNQADIGIVDWKNISEVSTESKRSLVFFGINLVLDVCMALLFITNV